MKEVITRPLVKEIWKKVEKYAVPEFKWGYTVSESIAKEFNLRYQVNYITIRNMPPLQSLHFTQPSERFILYQGTVNEARGLEYLVQAMKWVDCKLIVCGDGNFMPQLKKLINTYQLENKIDLKGMLTPDELWEIAPRAFLGAGQAEKDGLNQFYALPNKFFDYIHAGIPQVTMNYPEYRKLNDQYNVALLIDDLSPKTIADAINSLLSNDALYKELKENCIRAREVLNWRHEEKKLVSFYRAILPSRI